MNKVIDFHLDDLHLFETSLLGKAIDFYLNEKVQLVVPCYNPNFKDKKGNNVHSLYSYLVFENLEYYSTECEFYKESTLIFSGTKFSSENIFKSDFSLDKKYSLSCIGFNGRIGWLNYEIIYSDCYLYAQDTYPGFNEPNLKELIKDVSIVDFLMFPQLDKLARLIT